MRICPISNPTKRTIRGLDRILLSAIEQELMSVSPDISRIRELVRDRLHLDEQESRRAVYEVVRLLNRATFPPLDEIEIVLTEACNLACSYCFEGGMTRRRSMTIDVAAAAIDLLFDYAQDNTTVSIIFFGGEPLLNFRLVGGICG